jgi:hypothetical protein
LNVLLQSSGIALTYLNAIHDGFGHSVPKRILTTCNAQLSAHSFERFPYGFDFVWIKSAVL